MKRNWKDRELGKNTLFGLIVSLPVPEMVELIATDWDWLWLDCQHGMFDTVSMRSCLLACNAQNAACIVRVPFLNEGDILHALDAGADGIIVPMVDTPDQAQSAVTAAKFPPLGRRSFGSPRLLAREGAGYAAAANEETLLVVQLETGKAMENIEAIAKVDGVDALMIGPFDLAISLGNPPEKPWSEGFIEDVLTKTAKTAVKHNKILGAFLTTEEDALTGIRCGCTLLAVATDQSLLKSRSIQSSKAFRALEKRRRE